MCRIRRLLMGHGALDSAFTDAVVDHVVQGIGWKPAVFRTARVHARTGTRRRLMSARGRARSKTKMPLCAQVAPRRIIMTTADR